MTTTTLILNIVSSPHAVLDHNDPTGNNGPVPTVFVVEAVITNTGTTTTVDLNVNLDYNEDVINNWVLVPGENPDRTVGALAPGDAYHAYWFASYALSDGASHQYTVSVEAANTSLVATSDNYYGNPEPGKTVKTSQYLVQFHITKLDFFQ